jgi:hypothetical protein
VAFHIRDAQGEVGLKDAVKEKLRAGGKALPA